MIANGLIITNAPSGLRYMAALVLLTFLPGWVWLPAFSNQPVYWGERLTLAIGLSLALTIFGAMFAVYLPGPLGLYQLLIIINAVIITGLLITTWQSKQHHGSQSLSPPTSQSLGSSSLTQPRLLLILFLLLLVAVALRLPRLGYAEFHEDEAEALMLAVRLFQGEDYALFLHRKGPAQMLVPVAFWLLTDRINETLVRFPFALSSALSVVTLFFMGRSWFNWPAGAIAALLWAVNGYAIGFGRMVQYQALIFFLGPLAIYCLYLAWKYGQPRLQILGGILLATCLLAHFDALLLLPAAGYLGWSILSGSNFRGVPTGHNMRHALCQMPNGAASEDAGSSNLDLLLRSRLTAAALALALFLTLLASFYIPYLLDPEFNNTAAYLTESRIKPGLLYNNLNLLPKLDKDYSSRFYLPVLALGMISFVIWQSGVLPKKWRWATVGLGLLLASTVWLPNIWRVGSSSLAVLPWLLLGLICFWLFPKTEIKVAWLTSGAPFIGYVFLVDDPRTHLYIMYPGAVLLAGAGWAAWGGWLDGRMGGWVEKVTSIMLAAGILLLGSIIAYDVAIFLPTESAFTQLQNEWDGSSWEVVYDDLPEARTYFGYPKREGWKTIGALRAQGQFPGDFRSVNEDFIIPIWYNYGQARSCYDTPAHFFVRAADEIPIADEQYAEVGRVQREGEIRLRIFSAGVRPQAAPTIYPLAAFEDIFDQLATPQQFARQAEPSRWVGTQFGLAIQFVGYDLSTTTVAPGDILHIDLYWLALKNPGDNYRAFVHLTDGTTLWSQQDDQPVCRLPTSIWRTGQHGKGQFRLLIKPETPAGRYPLIIGLYQADTLERLKITAGAGQAGDDFLWLGDIEVTKSN